MEHDKDFNRFIEAVRRTALTATEKAAMRSALLSHIERTPLSAKKSPYVVRSPYRFSFRIREFVFVRPLVTVLIVVFVVLSTGTAAALGAESTLPGDFLYPVKTKVTEPLARILRASEPIQEKVSYEWTLVEKRLEEAERLAAERRLEKQAEKIKTAIIAQRIKALETARKHLPLEEEPVAVALRAPSAGQPTEKALSSRAMAPQVTNIASEAALPAAEGTSDAPKALLQQTAETEDVTKLATTERDDESEEVAQKANGPTYRDAVRKIEEIFQKHRGIAEELGIELSDGEKGSRSEKKERDAR